MTHSITIKVDLSDDVLADVWLNAHIGYWSTTDYEAMEDSNEVSRLAVGEKIIEVGDGDESIPHTVTYETIALGIERILRGDEGCRIRSDLRMQVLSAIHPDDADIDADAADCIVQAGLFGEVRYG